MRKLLQLVLVVLALALAANALARKIRVRGASELRANLRRIQPGLLELRGRLSDDDRSGLGYAWIEIRGAKNLPPSEALSCPDIQVRVAPLAGGLRVQTDNGGQFCLRWQTQLDKARLRLRFAGDAYHGDCGHSAAYNAQAAQQLATELRFDAPPVSLRMDRGDIVLSAQLRLRSHRAHADLNKLPIALLADGKALAKAQTSGNGKVRFRLSQAQLGQPRTAQLQLRFAGTRELASSRMERRVSLRAAAQLKVKQLPKATAGGDSAGISVGVFALQAPVNLGVVEATATNGNSLASAPVRAGVANLVVPVPRAATESLSIQLRYLPASPSLIAGPPLALTLAIAPPSPVWRIALLLVVLLAGVAVTLGWRRSDQTPAPVTKPKQLPPGVHVVSTSPGSDSWYGSVVDAHSGEALAGVTIIVKVASMEDDGIVYEGRSDEHGQFEFALDELLPGATLRAESTTHSGVKHALPSRGRLRIALETRRRSALRRFVAWTQRQGRPFQKNPEATPAHVARVASDDRTRRWAEHVETAVYGPAPVDREAEQTLHELEP